MLTAVQPPSPPGPGAVSTEPARFQERVGGRDPPVAQKPCLSPGTLLPNSEFPEPQADRRGRALPPPALPFSAMTNTIITMTILKILFSAVRRGGTLARARPAPSPGPLGLGTMPATPRRPRPRSKRGLSRALDTDGRGSHGVTVGSQRDAPPQHAGVVCARHPPSPQSVDIWGPSGAGARGECAGRGQCSWPSCVTPVTSSRLQAMNCTLRTLLIWPV